MLTIVNAKLNLGLRVLRKRPDGYHDLETVFYPVGVYNGTPQSPYPFCDALEILPTDAPSSLKVLSKEVITEDTQHNIVWKAYQAFQSVCASRGVTIPSVAITLSKHLPMQAGLGGGSADATFTLRLLNTICGMPLSDTDLLKLAAGLGADCPFFVRNKPALAHGIGERLSPLPERLKGKWAVVVKPYQAISTAQAFANIHPHGTEGELEEIYLGYTDRWKELMVNDFEQSFATLHPECMVIKEALYASGAFYASLSGSGSAFFGLYNDHTAALEATRLLPHDLIHFSTLCLL